MNDRLVKIKQLINQTEQNIINLKAKLIIRSNLHSDEMTNREKIELCVRKIQKSFGTVVRIKNLPHRFSFDLRAVHLVCVMICDETTN